MDVSFQLYSSREVPSQIDFLSRLADLGYTHVEGFGGVYDDPPAFRAALDTSGLKMASGHMAVADLESDVAGCLNLARTMGMNLVLAPYLETHERPTDTVGYAAFAKRLAAIHSNLNQEGLTFGWHNHDFELQPLEDGSIPLDVILTEAPDIAWEADLAWIVRGGADASDWVKKYGERMAAVHVKDLAPDGEKMDEDGWADVGEGTIDWASLVTQCRATAPYALMVMEHDKPADAARFAATSIAAFKGY